MAETVHLFLKINGKDVKGESTITTEGRDGSIECLSYEQSLTAAREASTNTVTGRRQFMPLKVLKRIDKASPILLKALGTNERVDGVFKFYRPNPAGDGTTEQFYTVELEDGKIAGVSQLVKSTFESGTSTWPPLEEISFVFKTITWTYTQGGATHKDTWK
jgi:type VI secretion system secreted protein Hcp